jgi:hypothetical protein
MLKISNSSSVGLALSVSCLAFACAGNQGSGAQAGGGGAPSGAAGDGSSTTAGTTSAGSGNLPEVVPPRSPPGSCGLDKPAFCEDFEKPAAGGRGGDLDESVWAFSRWGHETRQHFVRIPARTDPEKLYPPFFCGKPLESQGFGNDVVSCDGTGVDGLTSRQLNEVYDDQGDFAFNSMMVRQLFDFTDRTGTIVFDVDAKVNPKNLGHGWWVEVWITEDQAPMPYHEAPGVLSYPRTGFGINLQGLNTCPQGREATEVSRAFVTKDFKILHDYPGWELSHESDTDRCIKTQDQKLNRFKLLVSKDHVELWGSHFDDPTNLHRMVTINTPDLPFTRGYVHLQHSQYNARKDGEVTGSQTYRWDNVGFDGPSYAIGAAFQAPDNDKGDIDGSGGRMYGHYLTDKQAIFLPIPAVKIGDATAATLNFNYLAYPDRGFIYNFNGGPDHTFTMPHFGGFAIDVPVGELKDGDNMLSLVAAPGQGDNDKEEVLGNIELSFQAK